jgi:DNA-binding IscR family transcriptional regulator
VALTVCIDGTPGECDLEPFCHVRGHWQQINVAVEAALARISLAELAGPTPAGLVQLGRGSLPGRASAPTS